MIDAEDIKDWLENIGNYGMGGGYWIPSKESFEQLCQLALKALPPEGGERWVKDAARYRKLVSQAVEGDWGCHTGWRLNVDIKGAPSIENIDDAIDAQFSLPIPTQKDRS